MSWRRDVWHILRIPVERLLVSMNSSGTEDSRYPTPASITRTETLGFSANLPATTLPAVPPEKR
jgi:hypothetical protein